MHYFYAFGLNIASDLTIPEFLPNVTNISPDLLIQEGNVSESVIENLDCLNLTIPNVANFLIELGNSITYRRTSIADNDSLRLFLLGSAMGAILQQKGYIVLHGNAISLDGKTCKVFVGNRGAGKSTSAAWNYLQGAKILSDDVCAISFDTDGVPLVIPSYPQLKLWQTSTDLLGISTHSLKRIRQQEAKYALPIVDKFITTPMPLSRVIELDNSIGTTIERFGLGKLDILRRHTYRYNFLQRMGVTTPYTKLLVKLAAKITVSTEDRMQMSPEVANA